MMVSRISPALRLAFVIACRERNIDQVTGLQCALEEWTALPENKYGSTPKRMRRLPSPNPELKEAA
jgi:hypothetical protein